MSHVVHMVPEGTHRSACGFNVFVSETERIAASLDEVTCESCKRTLRYTRARRDSSA
jgi:hypothetical protein